MVRGLSLLAAMIVLITGFAKPASAADERQQLLRRRHVWAQFRPGSWRVVRVVTDSVDAQGAVVSTTLTETRTTLAEVSDEAIRLKVQASVELAGKKLDAAPQEIAQGLHGQPPNQTPVVRELGTENVSIGGKLVCCRVEEVELADKGVKSVSKVWVSDDIPPYVLKKQTITTQLDSGAKLEETTTEVVQIRGRRRILERLRQVAEIRAIHKHSKGKTITSSWMCDEVPGGIVAQSSQEFDSSEQLLRRSTLELVSFEAK